MDKEKNDNILLLKRLQFLQLWHNFKEHPVQSNTSMLNYYLQDVAEESTFS